MSEQTANSVSVQLIDIVKSFQAGYNANDHVNFSAYPGEIHALIGENGAGKSTLMNILYGMYQADSGKILINGKEAKFRSPADAIKLGVGMVHQHFMLVNTFSVLENIILGDEDTLRFDVIDMKRSKQKVIELKKSFEINVELDDISGGLAVGIQQKIEILKLLYRNAEIMILDEPTAVLTPQETEELFKTLAELKNSGKTIILITHKLGEVLAISDRVTVLRSGKVTGILKTNQTSSNELAKMITGRSIESPVIKKSAGREKIILEVNDLYINNDRGSLAINGISLIIKEGEIFGIAGVEGNGQEELAEAICGLRKISKGTINIAGIDDFKKSIAHIPANRHKYGIVKEFTLEENLILGREKEENFSNGWILNNKKINEFSEVIIEEYDIRPENSKALMEGLSGGNQQKAVAAREMTKNSDLVVISHPTRGLDILASEFVHRTILEESKKGKAILLISSDLSELLKLSDKIAVMYNGRITGELDPKSTNENEIGEYMTGLKSNKR